MTTPDLAQVSFLKCKVTTEGIFEFYSGWPEALKVMVNVRVWHGRNQGSFGIFPSRPLVPARMSPVIVGTYITPKNDALQVSLAMGHQDAHSSCLGVVR